ncbi:LytTR family DNA-binding domain-containing protein [Terrimonas sp. NA20]|uniref:LytTR family DNA-binding domain-containing protein n=1 Tax=Terrimonas ginsenosidimutans TaxID=2908004 RepID=A0ABS9KQG9_9BACT|nr:LytTR family DNA-binding domain-containing protein [Terrimonas ginsenosidimutans]MCG2614586.1 LytTR family DNA-binding domain-containing protein [Terrimonas ginsenosidimutans]
MTLKCLIVDDKPLAIDVLADYVSKTSFLELVGSTTNPVEGLDIVRKKRVDLVFLDIQMPELTGLQFIRLCPKECMFILTTAYSDYALAGYEYDVVDYLLKPIAFDRFYRAAEKALKQAGAVTGNQAVQNIISETNDFLFVKTEYRIQRINLAELQYAESLQNYVALQTVDGRILTLQTLKAVEDQLPVKYFQRVHRSFIIGLRHISSVKRSRILIGDKEIGIGDKYRDGFYEALERWRGT